MIIKHRYRFLCLLATIYLIYGIPSHIKYTWAVSEPLISRNDPTPYYMTSILPFSYTGLFMHSPTLTELPHQRILCAWFQGPCEGGTEVVIQSSIYEKKKWEKGKVLATTPQTRKDTGRYIRRVSNPMLMSRGQNIWLFYATTSLGLASSSLNMRTSHDGGHTWSSAHRIITSPFFNHSTLVRAKGFFFHDGTIGLPVSHELATQYAFILKIQRNGKVVQIKSIPGSMNAIQPTCAWLTATQAVLFLRDKSSLHRVFRSTITGENMTKAEPLTVPNPNKSLATLALDKQRVILVFNPDPISRNNLVLGFSQDEGRTFRTLYTFESSKTDTYDYPSLIADSLGLIHLVYTHEHKAIKHVVFNQAWLRDKQGECL